jgi:hypothetical protein
VSNTTTLSTSVSDIALSVTGYTEFGVSGTPASGRARKIIITNTGNITANNLTITQPTWPSGTTTTSTCTATLNPNSSCEITINPGSSASSACTSGIPPVASQILVSASNAQSININAYILGYGCNYQGGYIFSFDDSTPDTVSVSGKVATTADQATSIYWSADNTGTYVGNSIYGITLSSTQGAPNQSTGQVGAQVACDGKINVQCNTSNIGSIAESVGK